MEIEKKLKELYKLLITTLKELLNTYYLEISLRLPFNNLLNNNKDKDKDNLNKFLRELVEKVEI